MVYPPQGNLDDKQGICPKGDNQIWLALFKNAIKKCANERERVRLKVKGFASMAPVTEKGRSKPEPVKSDTLNYQIAHERAEALIYFLTTESYTPQKCETALKNGWRWESEKSNSANGDLGFDITHETWPSYTDMKNAKIVDDGTPKNRLRDLEFLNRTVQIIIEEGGCLQR